MFIGVNVRINHGMERALHVNRQDMKNERSMQENIVHPVHAKRPGIRVDSGTMVKLRRAA
jgi:hypothetical protein